MSVKVGVRVRPFNQRQLDLNCRLCVDMIGPTTRLFDADDPQKHRDFTFDYSFWSHDQFTTNEEGYFVPDSDKYADQRHVFEKVGLQILSNAWEGYHCCLFAYGQTGSGKSYSMVGYGANKGIVPISCEQIFTRVNANEDKNKQYEISVSMLEIYNEKVQDLLVPISKRQKDGYKIRQHKTLGIYVEGLSKHCVDTYQAIEQKMDEGSKNRSIAATQMNANSSRAHTIILVEFRQKQIIQGKKREKLSVIYLVDLAGSEKVGKTGATGDRLKEAAGINKSLSVLGLVISTLADKSMGKGKGVIVPYRDSCLTRILQNALGGNSKTLMICAVSPATDNYEQTLSTLRYADQAKKIQNKAVVNESQTDKMIRNLTAEKDELRDKVAKFQQMFKKLSMGLGIDPEKLKQFDETKEQLRFNNEMMNDYSMSKSQKLENQKAHNSQITQLSNVDKTKPHLSNLNQDPQLSRRINYSIDKKLSKVGRRNVEPPNDIQIGGIGIKQLHALIEKQEQTQIITIRPTIQGQDTGCYLNGNNITEKIQLKNNDRLTFGGNNMFVVIIPGKQSRSQINEKQIDWQFTQNQLYLKKQMMERQQNEERERKIKEQAELIVRQKQEQLEELQKKLKANQQMRANMVQQKQIQMAEMQKKLREQQAERLSREIEMKKRKMKEQLNQQNQRSKSKYYIEKKMVKVLPKCIEINLIAKQFRRNISMSVKMLMNSCNPDEEDEDDQPKKTIKIKVVNKEVGYVYWWGTQKLSNRYYIIKDMSEKYFETGVIPQLTQDEDPFWDPPQPVLIGRAFSSTKSLAYLFDNPQDLTIIGEDDACGQVKVNMIPTDQTGIPNLCQQLDEQQQFEPQDSLNKPFYFNMIIQSATLPDNYNNIFVQYTLKVNQFKVQVFKTDVIAERTQLPVFNYKKLHSFSKVTPKILEYILNKKLIFKFFGNQVIPTQIKKVVDQSKNSMKNSQLTNASNSSEEKVEEIQKNKNIVMVQKQKVEKEQKEQKQQKGQKKVKKKRASKKQDALESKPKPQTTMKKQQKIAPKTNDPKKGSKQTDKKGAKNKDDCSIF